MLYQKLLAKLSSVFRRSATRRETAAVQETQIQISFGHMKLVMLTVLLIQLNKHNYKKQTAKNSTSQQKQCLCLEEIVAKIPSWKLPHFKPTLWGGGRGCWSLKVSRSKLQHHNFNQFLSTYICTLDDSIPGPHCLHSIHFPSWSLNSCSLQSPVSQNTVFNYKEKQKR